MKIIGLTGGIASGKSLVATILVKKGVTVIDADQLARRVVEPGTEPYNKIIETFGENIVCSDSTIDSKALGTIIFHDPDARKQLERITHPAIKILAEELLEEEKRKGTSIVFYVVPLLLEAGMSSTVDEVWVVCVDEEKQIERLMKRDGIPREEALRKIAAQMPLDEKAAYADVIIDNNGLPEETARSITIEWKRLLERISAPGS
jgi:dephospho-CoA kinase